MRMAVCPPSRPEGTIAVNSVDEAAVSRAATPPIVTRGSAGSTGRSLPSIVTRPSSTAQSGCTAEMRDELTAVIEWCSVEMPDAKPDRTNTNSGFVEFHVPIEVIAPAVWSILETDGNPNRRRSLGPFWHAYQVHAGLGRRSAALPA